MSFSWKSFRIAFAVALGALVLSGRMGVPPVASLSLCLGGFLIAYIWHSRRPVRAEREREDEE